MVLIDQARVETINSLTPYGANAFLLNALGQVYGVPQGQGSNATVDVVFTATASSSPVAGYVIPQGFTVSDGIYQYVVQDGGVTNVDGVTQPLTALATIFGIWPIPVGAVDQLVTSVPAGYTLVVTNPEAGNPATTPQTIQSYQAQVLQAGLAASQGMTRYLKTLLQNVVGVSQRLISARAQSGGGWEIIVGGGDLYQVANAIFMSLFDVSTLVGSTMSITAFTNANPGVVTTDLNYGLTTGTVVTVAGADPSTFDGTYTITSITETTFSVGVNTTGFGAYVSGGVITPNPRNVIASIVDYPDTYDIPIVLPPQQVVAITITWNTILSGFTGAAAVAQFGIPALVTYVNSVAVGQPMVLFQMQAAFQTAVASVLAPQYLTRMVFSVSINGIGVSPVGGTGEIIGDPESYFYTSPTGTGITILQG
jgi:hypothetical protein